MDLEGNRWVYELPLPSCIGIVQESSLLALWLAEPGVPLKNPLGAFGDLNLRITSKAFYFSHEFCSDDADVKAGKSKAVASDFRVKLT